METGASRSPEKTGQKRRIAMENAFAGMKTITLPRAGGTEQQSEFVCVNGRTFQVPRGKVPMYTFGFLAHLPCNICFYQKLY